MAACGKIAASTAVAKHEGKDGVTKHGKHMKTQINNLQSELVEKIDEHDHECSMRPGPRKILMSS